MSPLHVHFCLDTKPKLSKKLSDSNETWKLSFLDHCAGLGFAEKKFPSAQRAEISVKGEKMDKNARGARFFAPIPMKIGTLDLLAIAHICYFMTKVISARAARGNQLKRCKNGQKCAQSAHFCSDSNETWYT